MEVVRSFETLGIDIPAPQHQVPDIWILNTKLLHCWMDLADRHENFKLWNTEAGLLYLWLIYNESLCYDESFEISYMLLLLDITNSTFCTTILL